METTKMNTNDTAAEIAATPATTAPRKGLMQFDAIRDRVVGMIGAERTVLHHLSSFAFASGHG